MNATTTIQSGTIQMKRSHLVGLVVGVAALSVALTTGAQAVLDSTDNRASSEPSYLEGVTAMTRPSAPPRGETPSWVRSPAGPTATTGRELRVRSLARCYEVIPCRPTKPRASSISPMCRNPCW